jgi:hypothetical protein
MSTSGKVGGASSFLLPVAEAVFDIGDEADQRDAQKARSTMATKDRVTVSAQGERLSA